MDGLHDELVRHWVAGALFMALALLALAPLIAVAFPHPVLLVYLASPAYMLHQVEEHAGDRFRRFVNGRLFGGREVLTTDAVLVINLPGVWGVNLVALYLAAVGSPGWGLVAPWLMIVNAVTHVAASIRLRTYNPGLATSVILFLPLGLASLAGVPAGWPEIIAGLAGALAIHAAIVAWTLGRGRRLA